MIDYNPPLTRVQEIQLKKTYYSEKNYFGSQKLYYILRDKYPGTKYNKLQIDTWLSKQAVWQKTKRVMKGYSTTKPTASYKKMTSLQWIQLHSYSS
jgi:hypothetical protein